MGKTKKITVGKITIEDKNPAFRIIRGEYGLVLDYEDLLDLENAIHALRGWEFEKV